MSAAAWAGSSSQRANSADQDGERAEPGDPEQARNRELRAQQQPVERASETSVPGRAGPPRRVGGAHRCTT